MTQQVAALALALGDVVDVLLPGRDPWPSGTALGVQHPVMERLVAQKGEAALEDLERALSDIGAPFDAQDHESRTAAVARLEGEAPSVFDWLRVAVFQAYYENPSIVALIDARGTPYKLRPHMNGYNLPRFDVTAQTPTHGRGGYTPTDAVRRVDISGLNLDTDITTNWGLKR